MDKNSAIVNYLLGCPIIHDNPLFFNFGVAADNNKQLVTMATDMVVAKPYIDGSVAKRYTFTIIDYRSVVYQPVVAVAGYPNENMLELNDIQSIIDWISTNNSQRIFPDFGDTCQIDAIEAVTDSPNLNGVDSSVSPSLAKYSITIRVSYLDMSKVIWNN